MSPSSQSPLGVIHPARTTKLFNLLFIFCYLRYYDALVIFNRRGRYRRSTLMPLRSNAHNRVNTRSRSGCKVGSCSTTPLALSIQESKFGTKQRRSTGGSLSRRFLRFWSVSELRRQLELPEFLLDCTATLINACASPFTIP